MSAVPPGTLAALSWETGAQPAWALVLLHGLGASGHDLAPLAEALAPALPGAVRVVLPHAPPRPVTLNGGWIMPAWYDIAGLDADAPEDEEGVKRAARMVRGLLDRERLRGIPARRVVLGGFSQGAALASWLAVRLPERLGAVLAFSGYPLLRGGWRGVRAPAGLAAFVAHGRADEVVPVEAGRMLAGLLRDAGCRTEWHEHGEGHVVPEPAMEAARAFLQKVLPEPSSSSTST